MTGRRRAVRRSFWLGVASIWPLLFVAALLAYPDFLAILRQPTYTLRISDVATALAFALVVSAMPVATLVFLVRVGGNPRLPIVARLLRGLSILGGVFVFVPVYLALSCFELPWAPWFLLAGFAPMPIYACLNECRAQDRPPCGRPHPARGAEAEERGGSLRGRF